MMNNQGGNKPPLVIDRERVACLLHINAHLMKKSVNIYSNILTNQQSMQQISPQNKQLIVELYQNCTLRLHCNLAVLSYIHEKYHNEPNLSLQNRAQFPIIMSAPQDMPELNQLYAKLQELYPEALEFLKMKIQQMRQQTQGQMRPNSNSPLVLQPLQHYGSPLMGQQKPASQFHAPDPLSNQSPQLGFQNISNFPLQQPQTQPQMMPNRIPSSSGIMNSSYMENTQRPPKNNTNSFLPPQDSQQAQNILEFNSQRFQSPVPGNLSTQPHESQGQPSLSISPQQILQQMQGSQSNNSGIQSDTTSGIDMF